MLRVCVFKGAVQARTREEVRAKARYKYEVMTVLLPIRIVVLVQKNVRLNAPLKAAGVSALAGSIQRKGAVAAAHKCSLPYASKLISF